MKHWFFMRTVMISRRENKKRIQTSLFIEVVEFLLAKEVVAIIM